MRKIAICLMMLFALTTSPAFGAGGHEGHDHDAHGHAAELTQSQLLEKASGFVAKIVEKVK